MENVKQGGTINISDISRIPPEAEAEKKILESQDIKSILVLPVRGNKRQEGFIGFDNVREAKYWKDEDISILTITAATIGKAIEIRKCYVVYQQRESPCHWCPSLRVIETGEVHSEIIPCPSEENPTGWIYLTAFPLKYSTGHVTGIIEHITDCKAAERALEIANKKLQLLSGITRHDILNQVTGLTGYTELLSEVLPDDPEMQKYIDRITEATSLTMPSGTVSNVTEISITCREEDENGSVVIRSINAGADFCLQKGGQPKEE